MQDSDMLNSAEKNSENDSKQPTKKESFLDRWENSSNPLARFSYKVLQSIWTVVMAIGMFLAWLIALLAT